VGQKTGEVGLSPFPGPSQWQNEALRWYPKKHVKILVTKKGKGESKGEVGGS